MSTRSRRTPVRNILRSTRRALLIAAGAAALSLAAAPAAGAAPTQLVLSQGAAFSLLGHSCGGIQEKVWATGFAPSGYPQGDAYLSTSCGGSGRGGGYKTTTYSAWASVVWTWFGQTLSYGRLEGPANVEGGFSAEDSHHDRVFNESNRAYLETGEPPFQPPAAPTGVSASVSLYEAGSSEYLRMTVSWTAAPATAGLLSYSTVTATPVDPGPPALEGTASGAFSTVYLGPVQPNTTYLVTVTNTDQEGTSEATSTEVTSPNQDGEIEKTHPPDSCQTDTGTIKLSPGLTETPHVQNITIKGTLGECDGPNMPESARFVAHLTTTEEVTCSQLQSISEEPTTSPVSLVVKWNEEGTSHGTLLVPVTEAAAAPLSGSLSGGPFGTPQPISGSIYEYFPGGATCGVAEGKKKPKPVKNGVFSGTALELG